MLRRSAIVMAAGLLPFIGAMPSIVGGANPALAAAIRRSTSGPAAPSIGSAARPITRITPWDWRTYGYNSQHTFDGHSTLTKASVAKLAKAWFFPTGDAVTATPTVVNGVVYFGSWDTRFYAVSLATGRLLWKVRLDQQHAVTPYPGETNRDDSSDGGLVTSSAWFEPGNGVRPDLVIFGGGYTLYALNAHTGAVYWKHAYTGKPWKAPEPNHDGARIFSSPVVFDGKVLFGLSVDGQKGERGYVAAASLATGDPVWYYQTDVSPTGQVLNNGCGNVWSSGTILPKAGLAVFDEADCNFLDPPPTSETVFALHISNGQLAWRYRPHLPHLPCDRDFGATPNAGVTADGRATFLGVGRKRGTYYSLDPLGGQLRWKTNVVFGGFSGGFIASAAYDGKEVIGSTALGDFGRFESNGPQVCDPGNPKDKPIQEPSVHAFDAGDGRVLWQARRAQSFGPTTISNGMSFNALALSPTVQVRSIAGGRLLTAVTLPLPSWSGIATAGDALVLGTGTSSQGSPAGVYALTPGGQSPRVPG